MNRQIIKLFGFIVVLFAINLWLRLESEPGAVLPVILSVIAVAMLGLSGWLGGELVYVHGIAVEPQNERGPVTKSGRR